MKNILLLIAFTISPYFLVSQDYTPFLEGNPVWKVYGVDNAQPSEDSTTDVEYSLQGDTTISGISYRILDVDRAPSSYQYPFIDEAYLRENEETRQVFIRFKEDDQILFGGNEELLLYDFGLTEGDSFFLYEDFEGNEVNILNDTTYTIDGESRTAWLTDFPSTGSEVMKIYVEGVGFLSDLLMPVLYEEFNFYEAFTYCYNNSSQNIFQEFSYLSVPSYFNCNSFLSTETLDSEPELAIYPNPASSLISIELSEMKEVVVSDLLGKIVHTQSDIKSDKLKLNTLEWTEGIYLVKAYNRKGDYAVRRLVVRH
ncbi:MAG TPA: T9SS type A sorting domain-containing protein [Cryomorphaceae bacterium]|nr:T9SS type A sorting domain-containing protein [Cryomorphaceae bacterium]